MLATNDESTVDVAVGHARRHAERGAPRDVYVAAMLMTVALALVGFWPTYFGPLLSGGVPRHRTASNVFAAVTSAIHVHAVVYVLWLLLFVSQVLLAATGRIALHMRVGRWLMAYGFVLIGAGLMVASEGFAARLATGDVFRAQRWLFGILRELAFFAPFLVAGWIYRRRPEIHKRLMIVATLILVVPAVGRMTFLGTPPPLWKYMVIWPLPVYMAMIHDFRTQKLVHPVYVTGLAAMLAIRLVLPFGSSPTWQAIARGITAFYSTPMSGAPR
jgi:hypothetical protein